MKDVTFAALALKAADRDKVAWDALVLRFTPLILTVTGGFRLRPDDAAEVSQTLWLKLARHIGGLREPASLPVWIMTTASGECIKVLNERQRAHSVDPLLDTSEGATTFSPAPADNVSDDWEERLEHREHHTALLAAFAVLPSGDRDLLMLLLTDRPTSHPEISRMLKMPQDEIGPRSRQALDRLRHTEPLLTYCPRGGEAAVCESNSPNLSRPTSR